MSVPQGVQKTHHQVIYTNKTFLDILFLIIKFVMFMFGICFIIQVVGSSIRQNHRLIKELENRIDQLEESINVKDYQEIKQPDIEYLTQRFTQIENDFVFLKLQLEVFKQEKDEHLQKNEKRFRKINKAFEKINAQLQNHSNLFQQNEKQRNKISSLLKSTIQKTKQITEYFTNMFNMFLNRSNFDQFTSGFEDIKENARKTKENFQSDFKERMASFNGFMSNMKKRFFQ